MPLNFQKRSEDFQLGIWRMDESFDELLRMLVLNEPDRNVLNTFKSEYRKLEWLTTRVLLKEFLASSETGSIVYESNGKPRLVNSSLSISISHTKNFVALLIAKSAGAGIDLETIQPRIEKIAKKFVTKQEEIFIDENKKQNYHHVIWGTKEVLFKIYGKGELNFLEHLHAEKFILKDTGELTGRITKDDFKKEYRIFYEKLDNLMLVYALDN